MKMCNILEIICSIYDIYKMNISYIQTGSYSDIDLSSKCIFVALLTSLGSN